MCGIEIQSIILDETCLEGRTEADWNVHLGGDREESERRRECTNQFSERST